MPGSSDKPRERRLLKLFATLGRREQDSLLDYARFLSERTAESEPAAAPRPAAPDVAPAPPAESVVGAIKRLSAGYPMVDKARVLNQTSSLMAQHIMQGRKAPEVIAELERLFEQSYQELLQEWERERDS